MQHGINDTETVLSNTMPTTQHKGNNDDSKDNNVIMPSGIGMDLLCHHLHITSSMRKVSV